MSNADQQSVISRYRTELMGLAILWVFFYHTKVTFPDAIIFLPLKLIRETGYGGVDIFIFLSGFGLVYGMRKFSYGTAAFYKRRILRIVPAYLLAVLLSFLVKLYIGDSVQISEALLKISATWFWVGNGRFLWYIPVIAALYLLFPIYYYFFDGSSNKKIFTFLSMAICYGISILASIFTLSYYLIFLLRIPVFFLGIYVGDDSLSTAKKDRSNIFYFCILLILLVLWVVIKYQVPIEIQKSTRIQIVLFIFIAYSLILLASRVMSMMEAKHKKIYSVILPILNFIGIYSLEMYLLHEEIVFPLGKHILYKQLQHSAFFNKINTGRIFEFCIYFIVTVLLVKIFKFTYTNMFAVQLNPTRHFTVSRRRD